MAAAFAAIPYLFEGGEQLSNPLDAYFEGMSGFTTTGASVVTDFDEINRSLGMWRQFTQWLGGMGIIVLAIAVLPRLRVGGRQLMESELPGPEIAALGERIRSTARKLWFLYVGLTLVQVLHALVALGGRHRRPDDAVRGARARVLDDADRRLLDAARLGRGLLGRGAVDPRRCSWRSPGANFALMYRAFVRRQPRALARDEEFRLYVVLVVGAAAALTAMLWGYGIAEGEAAVRARPLPGGLDHHDDRNGERRLRALAAAAPSRALRAHVRRRLGGLHRRLDQGRAPPPARARCCAARSTRR